MKFLAASLLISILFLVTHVKAQIASKENNKEFAKLFDSCGIEYITRHPTAATSLGYSFFDNLLPAEFTDSYYIIRRKLFVQSICLGY